jgi:site-specific recombinase XerD
MNLFTAVTQFAAYLRAHERSEATIDTYTSALRRFESYLTEAKAPTQVNRLTVAHITKFTVWLREQQQTTPRTRATYLACLSTFMDFMAYNVTPEREQLDKSRKEELTHEIRLILKDIGGVTRHQRKRAPDDDDVDKLLATVSQPPTLSGTVAEQTRQRLRWLRDRAMLYALAHTGMRVGELVQLKRGQLHTKTHSVYVDGKGRKQRLVVFSPQAWELLQAYLQERRDGGSGQALSQRPLYASHHRGTRGDGAQPLTTRSVQRTVEQWAHAAGIAAFHFTPHTFRHYFATRMLRETDNLAVVQDMLGHESADTTRIYAQTTAEDIVAAHQRVFGKK